MMMNKAERKRLERKGWKVGSAAEFLGLSTEEASFILIRSLFVLGATKRDLARTIVAVKPPQDAHGQVKVA